MIKNKNSKTAKTITKKVCCDTKVAVALSKLQQLVMGANRDMKKNHKGLLEPVVISSIWDQIDCKALRITAQELLDHIRVNINRVASYTFRRGISSAMRSIERAQNAILSAMKVEGKYMSDRKKGVVMNSKYNHYEAVLGKYLLTAYNYVVSLFEFTVIDFDHKKATIAKPAVKRTTLKQMFKPNTNTKCKTKTKLSKFTTQGTVKI